MQQNELFEILNKIKSIKTETQNIELKSAFKGCPEKLYDTLSSFSNQDDGGVIIFGIDEKRDFEICGVYDAADLQKKISEQCKQMEPPVRPLFTVLNYGGKIVVSVEIPGIDYYERPCFYRGIGKIKGSYIRVGDADEMMTEYEIYSYEAYKKRIKDDLRKVGEKPIKLFDEEKCDIYLKKVKKERDNLALNVSNDEILELMGVYTDGEATLSGVMVFSKYPQHYFPQFSITAVVVPGVEIGDIGVNNERFIDNKRITGPIDDMVNQAVDFVLKNIKIKTIIDDLGRREDKPEYPMKAIREAILNALVHRDYSRYSEGTPIRLEIYKDRIEITNPGSIYGGVSAKKIGNIRPETRNAILANILEILNVTENRYSGIPTIQKEMSLNGLPAPIFISKNGEFKIILKNSFDTDVGSLCDKLLAYCIIERSREDIANFMGLSKNYVMSKLVKPLVDDGKLLLKYPNKPQSPMQRYIKNNNI